MATLPYADSERAHTRDHVRVAWAGIYGSWPTDAQVTVVERHLATHPTEPEAAVRHLISQAQAARAAAEAEAKREAAAAQAQSELAAVTARQEEAVTEAAANLPLPTLVSGGSTDEQDSPEQDSPEEAV